MPSVINPRSGPFPVYTSASPPAMDVGLFMVSKTGVDLKSAGTTNVFTVPSSRNYICTGFGFFVTSTTNAGAGTFSSMQIKESSASRTMSVVFSTSSATPVANQTASFFPSDVSTAIPRSNCTTGNAVQFTIGASNAGSTAVAGTVYVTGFYSS